MGVQRVQQDAASHCDVQGLHAVCLEVANERQHTMRCDAMRCDVNAMHETRWGWVPAERRTCAGDGDSCAGLHRPFRQALPLRTERQPQAVTAHVTTASCRSFQDAPSVISPRVCSQAGDADAGTQSLGLCPGRQSPERHAEAGAPGGTHRLGVERVAAAGEECDGRPPKGGRCAQQRPHIAGVLHAVKDQHPAGVSDLKR